MIKDRALTYDPVIQFAWSCCICSTMIKDRALTKINCDKGLPSIQVRLRLPGAGLSCSRLRAPSGQESDPPPASHHCRPRVAAAARRGVAYLLMNSPVSLSLSRSPHEIAGQSFEDLLHLFLRR
jgi:hypothetical protein